MTVQGDGRLGQGRLRCRRVLTPGQQPARRVWFVRGLVVVLLLLLLGELVLMAKMVPEWGAWLHRWLFEPFVAAVKWFAWFGVLFLGWTFFFAQFLLPLERFEERWKMTWRVLLHAIGWAGPVVWVQDGQILSVADELLCRGPGLVVTDLASAVVLRNNVNFTRVVPPGRVGFLRSDEAVADVLDLREVTRIVGPQDGEDPFAPRQKDEEEQAYRQRQARYRATRGITRDGIEAVPRIWLLFHLRDEVEEMAEEEEEEPVEDAASQAMGPAEAGQPPNAEQASLETEVPSPDQGSAEGESSEAPEQAAPEEIPEAEENVQATEPVSEGWWGSLERCLHDRLAALRHPERGRFPPFRTIYHGTAKAALWAVASRPIDVFFQPRRPAEEHSDQHARLPWDWIPAAMAADLWRDYVSRFTFDELFQPLKFPPKERAAAAAEMADPQEAQGAEEQTGLKIIEHLINERLTKSHFRDIDEYGRPAEMKPSPEYAELKRRGLQVKRVVIIGIAFPPDAERELAELRVNTWLQRAQVEREVIERQRANVQEKGEAQALAHLCGYCAKDFPDFESEHLDPVLWEVVRDSRLRLPADLERRYGWHLGEMVLQNVAAWVNRAELRQRLGAHEAGRLRKLLALLRQYHP